MENARGVSLSPPRTLLMAIHAKLLAALMFVNLRLPAFLQ